MFNGDLKKTALEQLEKARKRQVVLADEVEKGCTELHTVRHQVSTDLMKKVEGYINTLANKPKEFESSYQAFKAESQ